MPRGATLGAYGECADSERLLCALAAQSLAHRDTRTRVRGPGHAHTHMRTGTGAAQAQAHTGAHANAITGCGPRTRTRKSAGRRSTTARACACVPRLGFKLSQAIAGVYGCKFKLALGPGSILNQFAFHDEFASMIAPCPSPRRASGTVTSTGSSAGLLFPGARPRARRRRFLHTRRAGLAPAAVAPDEAMWFAVMKQVFYSWNNYL
jgi:hypothetical protein